MDYRKVIQDRVLIKESKSLLHVCTTLKHFSIVTYAVPKERLATHIPEQYFDILEFETEKGKRALISAVPFIDEDFCLTAFTYPRFRFGQTNYRAYVRDKKTGDHVAWFFGTTLGSYSYFIARAWWKLPWHHAKYDTDCSYDAVFKRYNRYRFNIASLWSSAHVEIEDTGQPLSVRAGFESLDHMKLILTHPVRGFYHRTDLRLGTYSIWHPEAVMTIAFPKKLYFGIFDRLKLVNADEMNSPHSVFVSPSIKFEIYLPPHIPDL